MTENYTLINDRILPDYELRGIEYEELQKLPDYIKCSPDLNLTGLAIQRIRSELDLTRMFESLAESLARSCD